VAVASGTAALHLAVACLDLEPGDEIIMPTFTIISCALAAVYCGAVPRLVDADQRTWCMDTQAVRHAVGPRTRAIMPVHIYGHPVDMDPILDVAEEQGLTVIEDAAEAHGAEFAGRRAGGMGLAGAFSFYANKIITTGEGGMVTTNDPEFAAVARRLRDHAFSPERHFWHEYLGFNYRMTNLQAAVGLAQTERLDEILAARRRLRDAYDRGLRGVPGLVLPTEAPGVRNVFWMYALRVTPALGLGRDELRQELARRGVETRTFFVPMHLQPIYFEQFRGQRFPVAEALGASGLYLPTSEALDEADARWICDQIAELHEQASGRAA